MSKQNKRTNLTLPALSLAVFLIIAAAFAQAVIFHPVAPGIPVPPDPVVAGLNNLVSLYQNGRISVIDISSATAFSWDRFYLFAPYTPAAYLDTAVGISWRNNCSTQVESSGRFTLLVFTKNGTVVHCADYPGENDFAVPWPQNKSGLAPQQALFVLDDRGRLVLKDAR